MLDSRLQSSGLADLWEARRKVRGALRPTPYLAFTMLLLFSERKTSLTTEQFDKYVDEVVSALERIHDEKYRLLTPEGMKHDPSSQEA